MQYTVRGVSEAVDEALRRRARREGKSLNEVTIEAPLPADIEALLATLRGREAK